MTQEITLMRYAQLSGNTVVNVIEAATDPDGVNGEWVACGDAGPGWTFDGTAFHTPAPATAPRHITPLAFRRLFTPAERALIEWAAVDRTDQTTPERMQAAALRSSLKDQAQAQYIDRDDSELAPGIQGLEALGLLAAGRADEILASSVWTGGQP